MSKVSLAFFTVAPIYCLIGMIWGGYMGATGDHTMTPAHAHLNLLGFVLNGVMGAFYGLAGAKAANKLAWANFWLSNIGIVVMIPLLVIILAGNEAIAPVIIIGEAAAILGVGCFLANVLKVARAKA